MGSSFERLAQARDRARQNLAADLEAHRVAAVATPQLLLDGLEQVLGFFFVDLEVPVAGDAEGVGSAQPEHREDLVHVARDEIFEQHERASAPRRTSRG